MEANMVTEDAMTEEGIEIDIEGIVNIIHLSVILILQNSSFQTLHPVLSGKRKISQIRSHHLKKVHGILIHPVKEERKVLKEILEAYGDLNVTGRNGNREGIIGMQLI
jgi:hypothetical protein